MSEASTELKGGEPQGGGGPAGGAGGAKKAGRLQEMLVEYGVIGIVVLLSLSALTYLGFAFAFLVGLEVEGAGETAGVLAAAAAGWALTKPIRIPLAVVLTPVVAKIWHRVRRSSARGPEA
jgi:hypothetical protein